MVFPPVGQTLRVCNLLHSGRRRLTDLKHKASASLGTTFVVRLPVLPIKTGSYSLPTPNPTRQRLGRRVSSNYGVGFELIEKELCQFCEEGGNQE